MKDWFSLCDEHPVLKLACGFPLHEPIPPRRLNKEQFAALVGALMDPEQGAVLRVLLIDLLGPQLVQLVKAVQAGQLQ